MMNEKLNKDFLSFGFLQYILSEDQTPEKINYVQVLKIEPAIESISIPKNIKFSSIISDQVDSPPTPINFATNIESDISPENQTIASETIALIYERQGALSQAINIYRRLIELEPEKSDYFINRISELEKALNS
jgi:tetratricopeptide (TPR) repeat protein